jgi:cell division protein FtsW (lipid II flippase)
MTNSQDQDLLKGCLVMLVIFLIVQGLVVLLLSMTWWPRDDLAYCLLSLGTVLMIVAITVLTIINNKQMPLIKKTGWE